MPRYLLLAVCLMGVPACTSNGQVQMLGYTTEPNYDASIRTVCVPIFHNRIAQAGPFRELEMTLTRAVIREIEAKTPFKVVADRSKADTELLGTIVMLNKNVSNRTQINNVREAEIIVSVELVWTDLRPGSYGRILSQPPTPEERIGPATVFDPDNPVPPPVPTKMPTPVTVQASGRVIQELGESISTGLKQVTDRLAVQIVSMMEKPW
jgi:hypothetical protein